MNTDDALRQTSDPPVALQNETWWVYWSDLSICYCLWRAGDDKAKKVKLWHKLLDKDERHLLQTRLSKETSNRSDEDSLLGVIHHLSPTWWRGWHPNLNLRVRSWSRNQYPTMDGEKIAVVLEPTGMTLVLTDPPCGRSHEIVDLQRQPDVDGDARFQVRRRNLTEDRVDLSVKILRADRKAQLWMTPYMEVVDNELINCHDAFRSALSKIAGTGLSPPDLSACVSALIDQYAKDWARKRGSVFFHADFPPIEYRVEPERRVIDTIISSNGKRLLFTLGLKDPFLRNCEEVEVGTEKKSTKDWPCGVLLAKT